MTFYESIMLYFSTAVAILALIAGGWVKIRDYFRAKIEAQAAAIAAAKNTVN